MKSDLPRLLLVCVCCWHVANSQLPSENEAPVLFDGGDNRPGPRNEVNEGSGDGLRSDRPGGAPVDGRFYPDDEDSRGGTGTVEGSGDGAAQPGFIAFTLATLPAADGGPVGSSPTSTRLITTTRPSTRPPTTAPSTRATSPTTTTTTTAARRVTTAPVNIAPSTAERPAPPTQIEFTWPTPGDQKELPPTREPQPGDADEDGRAQRDLALLVLIIVIAAIALMLLGLVLCCVLRRCTRRRAKAPSGADPSSAHVHAHVHNESYMAGGAKNRQQMPLIQNV